MMQPPSFFKIAVRQVWLLPTLILALVGAGLMVGGFVTLERERQYETGGATATGQVTEKYTRRTSGKNRRTNYYLRYHFTTQDGFEMDGQDTLPQSAWNRMGEGTSVRIEYLRATPEKNRIAGRTEKTAGMALSGAGAAGMLVSGFFFLRSLKRVRTTRRLWEEGRRVDGVVSDVHATNVSHNRVKQWRIAYTYQDYAGRQHTGQSDYLPPAEAMDWKPGDKCAVLCDKDQPEISAWAGRGEG